MNASLTNHPAAPFETDAFRIAARRATSQTIGSGSYHERRFLGPRDHAAVSGSLESPPDRSRLRAADGLEGARLRAALAFLRARPAKNSSDSRRARFRV